MLLLLVRRGTRVTWFVSVRPEVVLVRDLLRVNEAVPWRMVYETVPWWRVDEAVVGCRGITSVG